MYRCIVDKKAFYSWYKSLIKVTILKLWATYFILFVIYIYIDNIPSNIPKAAIRIRIIKQRKYA